MYSGSLSTWRVLLIINRNSGTSNDVNVVERLRRMLESSPEWKLKSQVETIGEHAEARSLVSSYLRSDDRPATIIVGGGGGTLRAAVETICEGAQPGRLPGRERVRIAALRMGSGNVLARQLGAPRDAQAGLAAILENLQKDVTAPCAVMRCEVGASDGRKLAHYAVTLGGFGQFGRVPGDLARWQRRLSGLHRRAASLLGVERLTVLEYALALSVRSLFCAVWPRTAETIEVIAPGVDEKMRLLTGLVMNFPVKALPLDPGVRVEDEALSLLLIPRRTRAGALLLVLAPRRLIRDARRIRVEAGRRVEIRLLDRDSAEFFLDEDPTTFYRSLTLEVMGSLAFVPGLDYRVPTEGQAT